MTEEAEAVYLAYTDCDGTPPYFRLLEDRETLRRTRDREQATGRTISTLALHTDWPQPGELSAVFVPVEIAIIRDSGAAKMTRQVAETIAQGSIEFLRDTGIISRE